MELMRSFEVIGSWRLHWWRVRHGKTAFSSCEAGLALHKLYDSRKQPRFLLFYPTLLISVSDAFGAFQLVSTLAHDSMAVSLLY